MSSSVVVPIEVEDIVISEQNRFGEGFHKDSEVFKDSYILGGQNNWKNSLRDPTLPNQNFFNAPRDDDSIIVSEQKSNRMTNISA